ncbi:hypothetical protein H1S01_17550 [Heliobacterium chlorum]|uniref:DUF5655 domain-containing protein n=1 Tax=Heliobacterium chlorum TaxID=2698 RepID=A0ABR7T8X2_HELCL|nr:hypothetical protein [Heliobacterium chlorum]MBC9786266.1 hypothetical protein [Heliobacterium chlorum]
MNQQINLVVPLSLKKMPEHLQMLYLELTRKCLEEFPNVINCPNTDKNFASIKVPLGKKKSEIFVQFKPKRDSVVIELHIDLDKVIDPQNQCERVPAKDYSHWTRFCVEETEYDLEYFMGLIRQSYKEVSSKHM